MARLSLPELLETSEFDAVVVSDIASELNRGLISLSRSEESPIDELALFIYCHLRSNPERMDASRPLLDALVKRGCSPFTHFGPGESSAYMDMLMEDDQHPIIDWCLGLPCVSPSAESSREQRIRSDTLTAILVQHPEIGSSLQMSSLDLYGFPLLEVWADGQTTLDRLLARHYEHEVVHEKGPRKDFEFADPQRGFTRVLNKVLAENPGTQHVHALRWHAWHHAYRAQQRVQADLHGTWGTRLWQAALRQFDKTLARSLHLDDGSPQQCADALWEAGIEYVLSRGQQKPWLPLMAGASRYQLLDCEEAGDLRRAKLRQPLPDAPVSTKEEERGVFRALAAADALVRLWSEASPPTVLKDFEEHIQMRHFVRALNDHVSRSSVSLNLLDHPAFIAVMLPMAAKILLSAKEEKLLHKALNEGAFWPSNGPWGEIAQQCEWPDSIQSLLDSEALKRATPAPVIAARRRI